MNSPRFTLEHHCVTIPKYGMSTPESSHGADSPGNAAGHFAAGCPGTVTAGLEADAVNLSRGKEKRTGDENQECHPRCIIVTLEGKCSWQTSAARPLSSN
jgi:hypothetical protein